MDEDRCGTGTVLASSKDRYSRSNTHCSSILDQHTREEKIYHIVAHWYWRYLNILHNLSLTFFISHPQSDEGFRRGLGAGEHQCVWVL